MSQVVTASSENGFWVGFNDLNCFTPDYNLIATSSSQWFLPPRLGQRCQLSVFNHQSQSGDVFGSTGAVNYPIGARLQVFNNSHTSFSLVLNDIIDGKPLLCLYNHSLSSPRLYHGYHHWCTSSDLKHSYCTDFYKSHLLGGYGYPSPSFYRNNNQSFYHYSDSIVRLCLETGNHNTLVAISDVVPLISNQLQLPETIVSSGYFTHLLLSPTEDKLAFLYRFWLKDGGICTCLFSLDLSKTQSLSFRLAGNLSHFFWINNNDLAIYTKQIFSFSSKRIVLNKLPFIPEVASAVARYKSLLFKKSSTPSKHSNLNDLFMNHDSLPCYMISSNNSISPVSFALPSYDGHPSVSFSSNIFLADTYPIDQDNTRILFTIDIASGSILCSSSHAEFKFDIQINKQWLLHQFQLPSCARFELNKLFFTRSGLHCDLHPFLSHDSSRFCFHTTEDGYRTLKVKQLIV